MGIQVYLDWADGGSDAPGFEGPGYYICHDDGSICLCPHNDKTCSHDCSPYGECWENE